MAFVTDKWVGSYQGGFLGVRAFLAMINPTETLQAIGFAFTMATDKNRLNGRRYREVGAEPFSQYENYSLGRVQHTYG